MSNLTAVQELAALLLAGLAGAVVCDLTFGRHDRARARRAEARARRAEARLEELDRARAVRRRRRTTATTSSRRPA